MFHVFQTYVAFKCFMLHVFHAVRRVRGRNSVSETWWHDTGTEEWGAVSRWPVDMARGALGASSRGHDKANEWERGARMGAGRIRWTGMDGESYGHDDGAMRMRIG